MNNAAKSTSRNLPEVGDRVSSVSAPWDFPGDNVGTVIEHEVSQFGATAIVRMDTGELKRCSGLTEAGIGWYAADWQRVCVDDGIHEFMNGEK